jgi:hypothetical protein
MHKDWGHLNKAIMKNILKASKAPPEYLKAVDHLKCDDCEAAKKPAQSTKVGPPKPYVFNKEVGVDVFDLHDVDSKCHLFLNIVCMGTNFQIVSYLFPGPGQPKSELCMKVFMMSWTSWAGWPKDVVVDRGLHNRGAFARMLGAHGIAPKHIGLESPEQLGRTERHGEMWKSVGKRVINSRQVSGEDQMQLMAYELNSTVNDGGRKGGYSPSQWVLGKYPNRPGSGNIFDEDAYAELGVLSERMDPESAFQHQMQLRIACKKVFLKKTVPHVSQRQCSESQPL